MALAIDLASWALVAAGSVFVLVGAVGLVRMPELYTRMHAASVIESLGAGLLIAGMLLQAGLTLVSAKLLFLFALLFVTGPVVIHALAQAALHENIEPMLQEDRRSRRRGGGEQQPEPGRPKSNPL
jgi:multicomponent Na+:H+ antiporter subunit G